MTEIVLESLTKVYGNLVAVDNLNLEIRDKEFVCLLGPTGCGKTTTLYCIAGLEKPTCGNIYFDNVIVNNLKPQDRKVGLVFQHFALFPTLNVFENLAFGLRVRNLPENQVRDEVKKVANLLNLEGSLYKKPKELSLSEMQAVSLGRAMIIKPSVFLLDEPLSQLDATLRANLRSELKRLQKELGQTMIYVTHDQIEAIAMADRIAVMNKGKLQQYDDPATLYNYPRNRFVAEFIGSPTINFIDCVYEEKEGRALLRHELFSIDITGCQNYLKNKLTGGNRSNNRHQT